MQSWLRERPLLRGSGARRDMRLHRLAFENGWDKNVGTVTFTTFNTIDPTCAAAASTA